MPYLTKPAPIKPFNDSNALLSDYSTMLPQYLLTDKPALWRRVSEWHRFTGKVSFWDVLNCLL